MTTFEQISFFSNSSVNLDFFSFKFSFHLAKENNLIVQKFKRHVLRLCLDFRIHVQRINARVIKVQKWQFFLHFFFSENTEKLKFYPNNCT